MSNWVAGRRSAPAWVNWAVMILGAVWLALATTTAWAQASAPVAMEVFVREGCPHCAEAKVFLTELQAERSDLAITLRDVEQDPAALERLQTLARETGAGAARVPAVYVGGQLLQGFSRDAKSDQLIRLALAGQRAPVASGDAGTCEAETSLGCKAPAAAIEPVAPPVFSVDIFGHELVLDDVGLPAFTIALGLLDGFNPCSMWVLLLMISILAPLNDRPRMIAIAGTFVLVEGIAYFVFMAAWLNLFLLIGLSRASQLVIAAIAIAAGLINLKDFFAFGRGISLSIPDKAKPDIYRRMRGLVNAKSLWAAVVGAAVLAILVQVVEFMCTSGFPALFTRILTLHELDTSAYYGYLLLYNAAYMVDDVIILGIGVTLLSRHRLQEKEGRVLKLISGVVMVGLGLYLVFLA